MRFKYRIMLNYDRTSVPVSDWFDTYEEAKDNALSTFKKLNPPTGWRINKRIIDEEAFTVSENTVYLSSECPELCGRFPSGYYPKC